jgi:hypothetical protein
VNIKRAGERALCNVSLEKKRKSHWEFVLEEMAWMSNDFMQVLSQVICVSLLTCNVSYVVV